MDNKNKKKKRLTILLAIVAIAISVLLGINTESLGMAVICAVIMVYIIALVVAGAENRVVKIINNVVFTLTAVVLTGSLVVYTILVGLYGGQINKCYKEMVPKVQEWEEELGGVPITEFSPLVGIGYKGLLIKAVSIGDLGVYASYELGKPSPSYRNIIREAYEEFRFDINVLEKAIAR